MWLLQFKILETKFSNLAFPGVHILNFASQHRIKRYNVHNAFYLKNLLLTALAPAGIFSGGAGSTEVGLIRGLPRGGVRGAEAPDAGKFSKFF